jgi:hypothetical protein
MRSKRKPIKDPRTVAREIPGLFDALFPALKGGFVHLLNGRAYACNRAANESSDDLSSISVSSSLLFEVAVARAEGSNAGDADPDLDFCLSIATERQRRHYHARVPEELSASDKSAANWTSHNLVTMLDEVREKREQKKIVVRPFIPGYEWIASSEGDFADGSALIEVKCSKGSFGLADYRQLLMYWLLNYASAIEKKKLEWTSLLLLNPRRNSVVEFNVDEVIGLFAQSASKVEALQLFVSLVEEFSLNSLAGRG